MNHLHFGDNLDVMQKMPDASVELCYLDPPFGTGRDYNVFLHTKGTKSRTQAKAYTDIWKWGESAEKDYRFVINVLSATYPKASQILEALKGVENESWRMAYLAFMTPRLCHIHRILKNTGSVYLHCDEKMSHYLKIVMDNIFGFNKFRNELVWKKYAGVKNNATKKFSTQTDSILYYTKGSHYCFNVQYQPLSEEYIEREYKYFDEAGRRYAKLRGRNYQKTGKPKLRYLDENPGPPLVSLWVEDGLQLNTSSNERLGYDTQKPRALLERIVKTSSNPGDIVFDPFCGCGTTIDAAHGLDRRWIGIDKTILAIEPILRRMTQRHPDTFTRNVDYQVHGYPQSRQDAQKFAETDRFGFEAWVIGLLPKIAVTRKTGDDGFDGRGTLLTHIKEGVEQLTHVLVEVKSGKNLNRGMIRDFRTAMRDQNADLGIFITLEEATSGMRVQAAREGFMTVGNTDIPRIQFWQITDHYFKTRVPDVILPQQWMVDDRKRAEIYHGGEQIRLIH